MSWCKKSFLLYSVKSKPARGSSAGRSAKCELHCIEFFARQLKISLGLKTRSNYVLFKASSYNGFRASVENKRTFENRVRITSCDRGFRATVGNIRLLHHLFELRPVEVFAWRLKIDGRSVTPLQSHPVLPHRVIFSPFIPIFHSLTTIHCR